MSGEPHPYSSLLQRHHRQHQQSRPGEVEPVRCRVEWETQHDAGDEKRSDPDRDVHVEHPTPREVIGEQTTDEWAEHTGQGEGAGEVAGVAATFSWWDDVADDGERQ